MMQRRGLLAALGFSTALGPLVARAQASAPGAPQLKVFIPLLTALMDCFKEWIVQTFNDNNQVLFCFSLPSTKCKSCGSYD